MCGITGYISQNDAIDLRKYYLAHQTISHRGPCDEGFLSLSKKGIELYKAANTVSELSDLPHIEEQEVSNLVFGHARLSIIDLSAGGHQPFYYDGIYLVYNGEIFNYLELREELVNIGYVFSTETDTEVFLKAFHCWGVEAFNKFNGMWAAAIYDEKTKKTLLTRDRFGIKPLFYYYKDGGLSFSSEIKFINSLFGVNKINEQAVYDYIRDTYLEHSSNTFFKNVHSLEEGCYLEFDNDIKISRYYNHQYSCGDVSKLLDDSIIKRMRSDTEVGMLLSGGIDSSFITCKVQEKGYSGLKTFTADFNNKRFSEREYAESVLEKTGFSGDLVTIKPEEFVNDVEDYVRTHETPTRSLSCYLQYRLFKHISTKTNVKVVLSGQGADEIFSGYSKDFYLNLTSNILSGKFYTFWCEFNCLKRNLGVSSFSVLKQMVKLYFKDVLSPSDPYQFFNKSFTRARVKFKAESYFKSQLISGLRYSALKEYLRDEDRNSMRFSIESRLPFMDYRVVEAALSLENDSYIRNGVSKVPLREAGLDCLPRSIYERKDKMGFVSPQEEWQRDELKPCFDEAFNVIKRDGLFSFIDKDAVYDFYQSYCRCEHNDWALVWRLYNLYQFKSVWAMEEGQ